MESGITKAIFDRLAGDATLIAALAPYRGGAGLHSGRVVPVDADLPAVLVTGPIGSMSEDTLAGEGKQETRSIELWWPASLSSKALAEAAQRIFALFHRQPMTATGITVIRVRCTGPTILPADGQYDGRLVTVLVRYTVP